MSKRYWPKWWWRYPFCTGIFSPKVPDDFDPFKDCEPSQGMYASMKPAGGSPPPDYSDQSEQRCCHGYRIGHWAVDLAFNDEYWCSP